MLRESCSLTERPSLRGFFGRTSNIELLLGNGRTVVEQFQRTFKVRFENWKVDDIGVRIYRGDLLGRRFIGWSAFLSNSPMNRSQRARIGAPGRRAVSRGLLLGTSESTPIAWRPCCIAEAERGTAASSGTSQIPPAGQAQPIEAAYPNPIRCWAG